MIWLGIAFALLLLVRVVLVLILQPNDSEGTDPKSCNVNAKIIQNLDWSNGCDSKESNKSGKGGL